jgi:hypothetical protein
MSTYQEDGNNLYRDRFQVKTEQVSIIQAAAQRAHGSAPVIANAGDHYSIVAGHRGSHLVVEEGHKGIEVTVPKPEAMLDFWSEYENLQK